MRDIETLERALSYTFSRRQLLTLALTHPSFSKTRNNQRLEFLGDAILGLVVGEQLYSYDPPMAEGEMTKVRAGLVCEESLLDIATALDLGSFIIMGGGEENSGGRAKPSILADALEAVFGAVYIDGGFSCAKKVILNSFGEKLVNPGFISAKDAKSALQELCHRLLLGEVTYNTDKTSGPPHDMLFYVSAVVEGRVLTKGMGKTKKAAEQMAAKAAIEFLSDK